MAEWNALFGTHSRITTRSLRENSEWYRKQFSFFNDSNTVLSIGLSAKKTQLVRKLGVKYSSSRSSLVTLGTLQGDSSFNVDLSVHGEHSPSKMSSRFLD
ncbi:hypothetical protein CEXT_371081 [Caerostris extrusa]|uniref:Uncharacterized protein n=1 Tax=Caerostris extrusa TaxID=172846 RepID=A0AAV4RMV8_CAEEX|nr:hypothetical protein CEXT_371081 [Caerostris extrusa]